jgi:carbon-monoxide dehydrogenase medium subunit
MQIPPPFEYERATSIEHAIALLDRLGPEARLVAGGHSLLPMMKLRLARPEHLIDINDLDLAYVRIEGGEIDRRDDEALRAARVGCSRRALRDF